MLTEHHKLNDSCDSNMSTDHPTMHLFGVICNNRNVQISTCGLAEMPEVPSSAVTCQWAAMSRHPQSSQLVYSCNRLACGWAGGQGHFVNLPINIQQSLCLCNCCGYLLSLHCPTYSNKSRKSVLLVSKT